MSELIVIRTDSKARTPRKATQKSAGLDIYSTQDVKIMPNKNGLVSTGIKLILPEGTYGRIAPRSGLSLHHMINVMGGVIDPDYEGEIKVLLMNHSESDFNVSAGDRIAQLILEKYEGDLTVIEKSEFDSSPDSDGGQKRLKRGSEGFGSTGTAN